MATFMPTVSALELTDFLFLTLNLESSASIYFCPSSAATFMPNTFDQFGQPIVMMPYPPQQQPPVDGVVADDEESVPFETSDKNLEPDAENQASTEGLFVVDAAANELSVATAAATAVENGDLLPQEGAPSVVEVPEVNQGEEVRMGLFKLNLSIYLTGAHPIYRSNLLIRRRFLRTWLQFIWR